jgi:flagellar basal body P-ring formation protein FlgA
MDKQLSPLLLALALTASASASGPPPAEDAARLRQMAASHLFQQTAGLPGEVTINVELPKSTARLARCDAAEAFIPEGARLAGSLAVGIRCQAPSNWTTYVRASVSIVANYLVAAAPLRPGQVLTADVLESRRGDLGKLAQDVMTEPETAIGKVMVTGLVAGTPLRAGMLRAPQAVAQGQGVTLLVTGKGFTVSSEGRALSNAADGQVVQVRTASGQVVSGIARSGGLVDIAN